jgi:hypothetical protein
MKLLSFAPALFAMLCLQAGPCQENDSARGLSCISASKEIKAVVHNDRYESLQITSLPVLQEAMTALQVSASSVYPTAVRQIEFCEVMVPMFDVREGQIARTTLFLDRDRPKWLIALAPERKLFLLVGFPDPEKGFNELIEAVGLHVNSASLASGILDLYLRVTGGEELSDSIIADEMQLQSKSLVDFRQRYSLSKARALYAKWWAGISPALKKILREPQATAGENGFTVNYFRYEAGEVVEETIAISPQGTVSPQATRAVYTFRACGGCM